MKANEDWFGFGIMMLVNPIFTPQESIMVFGLKLISTAEALGYDL